MSIQKYFENLTNNTLDRFNYTMTSLMDSLYTNVLGISTDGTFKAVCLSGIRTEDNTGAGTDFNDGQTTNNYLTLVVRPLTEFGEILPDPATLTDPEEINTSISIHASVFTARSDFNIEGTNIPKFGQILNCYFEGGSVRDSTFFGLRFSEPTGENFHPDYERLATISGVSFGSAQNWGAADLLGSIAGFLGDQLLGVSPSSEEEIGELADRFEGEGTPNKSSNSSKISAAHPDFQKYIKAFIVKCADVGISITINSTHRNRAEQQELVDEYNRGERRIKPAQYSYHISGLAFDFNPTMPDGTTINSRMNKRIWIQTGVPQIGESVGLRWGGNFSSNYDPIHFDLGNKVDIARNKMMIDEANRQGVEVTAIPTGV